MLRNVLTVALRQFVADRTNALLNLLGLVVGFASFAVIYLFVTHELSFDRYHHRADDIYRLTTYLERGDQEVRWAITNGHLDPLLDAKVPEVERAVKLMEVQFNTAFKTEAKTLAMPERGGFFTDGDFFRIFDVEVLHGDPDTALEAPNHVVLTAGLAEKLFGTTDAVGRTFEVSMGDEQADVITVDAVVADPPANSHLQYQYLYSVRTLPEWEQYEDPQQGGFPFHVYFLARPGVDPAALRTSLDATIDEAYEYLDGSNFPMQPLTDIHFHADNLFEHTEPGNIQFVRILLLVGVLMLVIAGINYVTLSTSRSLGRAKEVGVRKAMGATRRGLVAQVLAESAMLGLVAAALALAVAEVALRFVLPRFFDLGLSVFSRPLLVPVVLGVGALVGALSGAFLASRIARFNPSETLRGRYTTGRERRFGVRDGLVMLQFVLTAALLVGSVVIFRQIEYLRTKDVGFTREFVVNVPSSIGIDPVAFAAFRARLEQEPHVASVGATQYAFISDYNATALQVVDPTAADTFSARLQWNAVDYGLLETLELELVEGRWFSREFPADEARAVVINEAARAALGLEAVTGKEVLRSYLQQEGGEVIGVVRDFHYQSPGKAVYPVMFVLRPDWQQNLLVRLQAGNVSGALGALERAWREAGIQEPFEVAFLDDWFEALLVREARLSALVTLFTLLSMLVAGLGLVGLVSYTATRRRKEIGVRKALGASVADVLALLNRRFLALIAAAFVLAVPLAWWGLQQWLHGFADRVPVRTLDFAVVGLVLLTLAAATVTLRAVSAARTNPAEVLREE